VAIQIDQISCPFFIAATNISIYSLNYNSLTPLEAFEGLYPIQTVSYPLTLTLGLPYGAPFQAAMQFYQSTNEYVQL
jgi:Leucine-rich repeat (LRR) protein